MADGTDAFESDELESGALSTGEIVEEARRPLLIKRHRPVIEEMEGSLSDSLVTGATDHPRLQTVLRELETASERQRIEDTLSSLANDPHFEDSLLRDALVDHCCLLREEQGVQVATLQIHIIGIYRRIRELMEQQKGLVPDLEDLRSLPAQRVGRLLDPLPVEFGSPRLADSLVISPKQAREKLSAIRAMSRAEGADTTWHDAGGDPPLPRADEEPLEALPKEARVEARARLIADRIRSQFYRSIFLKYFHRDELAPEEIDAHRTILHWLESIEETPHLYPFMQGQTLEQKRFRLGHLLRKIIQLNEMYQRVALASDHPTYRERFAGLGTRQRLAILAKDHYPALKVDTDFTMSTLLCPFEAFARWVQDKVESKDFVLPPEPRARPARGDSDVG